MQLKYNICSTVSFKFTSRRSATFKFSHVLPPGKMDVNHDVVKKVTLLKDRILPPLLDRHMVVFEHGHSVFTTFSPYNKMLSLI